MRDEHTSGRDQAPSTSPLPASSLANAVENPVRVEEIGSGSPLLAVVKQLWSANRRTLGFFPDGAFEEHASKRQILGAVTFSGELIGYVLYRRSYDRASIVHLCITPTWRRQGLAKVLVEALAARTKNLRGIALACRSDFKAHRVWPNLGFVARQERIGRSKQGHKLIDWWRDNHIDDLVARCQPPPPEGVLIAALDANVFFDLVGRNERREESLALTADWIRARMELRVTEELFNEIVRNEKDTGEEKSRQRREAHELGILRCRTEEYQPIEQALRPLFPVKLSQQSESDIRHLSRAIACRADAFITRDEDVLQRGDELYKQFDISILRPADLVLRVDELVREKEYRPARLAATHWHSSRVTSGMEQLLADAFHAPHTEGKREFLSRLRTLQANPRDIELRLVSEDSSPIALIAHERPTQDEFVLSMLRIRKHPLRGTLARHFLEQAAQQAAFESRPIVRVTETVIEPDLQPALKEVCFFRSKEQWVKISLNLSAPLLEVVARAREVIERACPPDAELHNILGMIESNNEPLHPTALATLERMLWPAKATDIDLPAFLIPIKRGWAEQLFDSEASANTLFGSEPWRAFAVEGAYYRSAHQRVVSAPGRILWYVSDRNGGGLVKACSHLDEVIIDKPKPLFRRFRRLGVYRWRDVLETAKGDLENDVMAIRFSKTELLHRPIPWTELQGVLRSHGVKTQAQSPTPLKPHIFFALYRSGMGRT